MFKCSIQFNLFISLLTSRSTSFVKIAFIEFESKPICIHWKEKSVVFFRLKIKMQKAWRFSAVLKVGSPARRAKIYYMGVRVLNEALW